MYFPRLTLRWLVAFIALILMAHDLHELAHTALGRALCGAWGPRDFNAWRLADGCSAIWPTIVGPLFSYAVMWGGVLLLVRQPEAAALGVALVLAPNPFARVFTAVMGGGDEGVVLRSLFGLERGPVATTLTCALVMLACVPPIVSAWRAARGSVRPAVFAALVLLPMLETGVLFVSLNPVLERGVLAMPAWMGAAPLIWIVSAVGVVLAVATWPALAARSAAARATITR